MRSAALTETLPSRVLRATRSVWSGVKNQSAPNPRAHLQDARGFDTYACHVVSLWDATGLDAHGKQSLSYESCNRRLSIQGSPACIYYDGGKCLGETAAVV